MTCTRNIYGIFAGYVFTKALRTEENATRPEDNVALRPEDNAAPRQYGQTF